MSIPAANSAVAAATVAPPKPPAPVDHDALDEHLARALNLSPPRSEPAAADATSRPVTSHPIDVVSAGGSANGRPLVAGGEQIVGAGRSSARVDVVGGTALREALGSIAAQQRRLDEAIDLAASGKTFSPQELLALQARTHRLAFDLNLVSKVVEQLTSGLKRTLDTQV